jgi:hypothetical protein
MFEKYCVLWIAINASLFFRSNIVSGVTTPCPYLPNCAECDSPTHCAACIEPGSFGMFTNESGCHDCLEVSGYTCSSCTHLSQCDTCTVSGGQGPLIPDPSDRARCADCATHCQFCAMYGAGKCDDYSCDNGYAIDATSRTCSPCADGCPFCAFSGPGACDVCSSGFGLPPGKINPPADCEACTTENCATCYWDNTVCETCKTGYEMDGSGLCNAMKR